MTELASKTAAIIGEDEISLGIAERFRRAGASVSSAAGTAHILVVNTLGPPILAPLEEQTSASFTAALDSVSQAACAMQRALPFMREQNWGRIILIGHRYGETVHEGLAPYNAAAHALVGLTRSAAVEWGRFGVTVNLVLPFADTEEFHRARQMRPKIIDLFTGQVPLRRAGDPVEDIGGAALYLAGDDGAFITGQILHADGGQHIAAPVLNPIKYR